MTFAPLARRFSIPLVSVLTLSALATFASSSALAAGPTPPFQLPTPCGQTWRASTYQQHWNGDQDALDLAQRDADQANLSDGEHALAAAAGTVGQIDTTSSGEHRLFIDHPGGWRTAYVHLKESPPLTIGQQVAQGQVVGIVSNSGTASPHLHFNQMADGATVRATFNGSQVATHAGDTSTWGHYGTDEAEAITSVNCAGNAFATFTQSGLRYQILYKPSTGAVKFMRMDANGSSATSVWDDDWGQRWTHIVPFVSGGEQRLFLYKAGTGEVRFDRVHASAQGTTTLSTGTWWAGWTHVTPFVLSGTTYLLVHDTLHGYTNLERLNANGNGTTNISTSSWTKGWTHFVPYRMGSTQYILLYKSGTGEVEIDTITGSGNSLSFTEVWSDTWTAGWSHLVPMIHQGTPRLFLYRNTSGLVTYNQFLPNGQGIDGLGSSTWGTSWTALTPMTFANGNGGLFLYRGATGTAQARQLNASGTTSSELWSASWTTGWR